VGDKETLHGATETFVEIENSSIHMYENHVVVKKEAIEDGESKDNENG
jgi:hypothetical protein